LEGIDPGRRRLRTDGVILCDGRSLPADLVVLCAGSRLTTPAPGICAVGECAEHRGTVWPHMAALAEQVRVLARRLAGDRGAFLDLEGTPGARRYERHRHPEKYPLDVITIRDKTP
jgi:NAD(P)H-nitrite reductase large subunit